MAFVRFAFDIALLLLLLLLLLCRLERIIIAMFNNNNRERERERDINNQNKRVSFKARESSITTQNFCLFERRGNTTTRKNARAHIGLAVALKRDRFDDDDASKRVKQKEALVKEASMK